MKCKLGVNHDGVQPGDKCISICPCGLPIWNRDAAPIPPPPPEPPIPETWSEVIEQANKASAEDAQKLIQKWLEKQQAKGVRPPPGNAYRYKGVNFLDE